MASLMVAIPMEVVDDESPEVEVRKDTHLYVCVCV